MEAINVWAVGVSAIGAFVISGIWYGIFGAAMAKLQKKGSTDMPPWKVLVELSRSLAVALLFATLLPQLGVQDWPTALNYAVLLWAGFPVVLLIGSIIHENVPVRLACIHAGDWLVKLLFIASVLTVWR